MKTNNIIYDLDNRDTVKTYQLNRVIIVDDEEDFAESLSEILEDKKYIVKTATNKSDAITYTKKFKPDIAILDIKIGKDNGITLIAELRKIIPDILCIMVTGNADITTVVNALREDAFDYLTKPIHPEEVIAKLKHGFKRLELERQQQAITQTLQASEERYRTIINNMVDGVIMLDLKGNIINFNHAAEVIFGYDAIDIIGQNIISLLIIKTKDQNDFLNTYITTPDYTAINYEINAFRKNKEEFPLRFSISELSINNNKENQFIFSCFDITAQKTQENQLRQIQKMDALGQLSSGIAHDYNNMLGIITGYAELLKNELGENNKLSKYAYEILHAGERSTRLTKKLLNFSRKKSSEASILNLNKLLLDQQHMLKQTLTVRINLLFDLQDNLWPVWLDDADMEDAILNMSINAMHATEGNGQLTLCTCNKTLSSFEAQQENMSAGDYVTLSVIDTGSGMDKTSKEKIFEPFFSTKGEKGTGLGLSQVYGFIVRSNGIIKVHSKLNQGTQLILYFPRYIDKHSTEQLNSNLTQVNTKGNETILIVDDEPALLELNCQILESQGYNIICAENASLALEILSNKTIDLLLTDIIMPKMNGFELAAIVQQKYSSMKIQLMSGFAEDDHSNIISENLYKNIIYKPVNSQKLLKQIRRLLDE